MSANYTNVSELYFCVDDEYADWLTSDVYDAFLVAAIYPCMYYNEPLEIDGCVSKKLYVNIMHYVQHIVKQYNPLMNIIKIDVAGYANASKKEDLHIGTGFSGGVDSFSTLEDWFFNCNDSDYRVDTLFFFNVGQYGNVANRLSQIRAENRFEITRNFAAEIGVNAIMMNTNLFDFYIPNWEFYAGTLCRITSVLVFQRALKRYYISNAITYLEMTSLCRCNHLAVTLAEFSGPYMKPFLSPNGLDIIFDGAQYKRTTKEARIANNPLVQKYLNVCVNSSDTHTSATNCGECSKCMRTMMAFDSLGVLDKFSAVFDLKRYEKRKFGFKCEQIYMYNKDGFARDNVDFACEHGNQLPSRFVAYVYHYSKWFCHLPFRVVRKLAKILHLK